MLGTFRYFLALMVTVSHLWPALTKWSGVSAVFGFNVISGYLMTLILQETYSFSKKGLVGFTVNRILRIYPTYLTVVLIAIVILYYIPDSAHAANMKFRWPKFTEQWISNFTIVGTLGGKRLFIPPAWSLDIELIFYAAMAIGLSRGRNIITLWFATSLAYTCYLLYIDASFVDRYSNYFAASLPFSIGAMVYAYKDKFCIIPAKAAIPVAALFVCTVVLNGANLLGDPLLGGFYCILLASTLVLIVFSPIKKSTVNPQLAKIDKYLGDLSYPVFLCHWHVAALSLFLFFDNTKPSDGTLWAASIILIHILSIAIYLLVDRNINKIRGKVRARVQ